MKYIIMFFLTFNLFGESTFISPIEYASQLYKNPRGIGCHKCHGENGEGKLIATYMHKGKKREFRGSPINELEYNVFYNTLNKRKRGMPRYYLTDKEIKALYLYLHHENENGE